MLRCCMYCGIEADVTLLYVLWNYCYLVVSEVELKHAQHHKMNIIVIWPARILRSFDSLLYVRVAHHMLYNVL